MIPWHESVPRIPDHILVTTAPLVGKQTFFIPLPLSIDE